MTSQSARKDVCDFCSLPLPRVTFFSRNAEADHETPRFCCFGCRFASSVTNERGAAGEISWSLTRLGLSIFFTMNVMVFTMVLWSRDFYAVAGTDAVADTYSELFRILGLLFSLPVLFLLGGPIFDQAWDGLKRRAISTDLLIIVGVAAAYAVSIVAVIRGEKHVYFEVGCVVLVLVSLGRWLEAAAKMKTVAALDALEKLLPQHAMLIGGDGDVEVNTQDLIPGNIVRVRAAERFPADGTIARRETLVDEQLFTGESWPVVRQTGDTVLGGTLNVDSEVEVEVDSAPSQGTFARLVAAVRHSREQRTRYETLADSVTVWFVPLVVVVALLTLGVHWMTQGFEPALMASLSVVLIACPCALGLATPLAVWCAIGRATGEQILFRDGDAIERLSSVRAIRFDKTGTLTTGTPRVAAHVCDSPETRDAIESIAASIAQHSTHSFAKAIYESCRGAAHLTEFAHVESKPGRGLSATSEDGCTTAFLGSDRYVVENSWHVSDALARAIDDATRAGRPFSLVGWNGIARGLFAFEETLRPESAGVIAELRTRGFDVGVLTGDHRARGARISDELNVSVDAALLPDEKTTAVCRLQARGLPVAFVGDGINDAPALVASNVGISMGCGTDLTRETADVCLLGNDLSKIPWLIDLSRHTCRAIRWNLTWAFGYNGVGVVAAACGLLSPALAALLMAISSFFVIANSLRIQQFPGRQHPTSAPEFHPLQDTAANSFLSGDAFVARDAALIDRSELAAGRVAGAAVR